MRCRGNCWECGCATICAPRHEQTAHIATRGERRGSHGPSARSGPPSGVSQITPLNLGDGHRFTTSCFPKNKSPEDQCLNFLLKEPSCSHPQRPPSLWGRLHSAPHLAGTPPLPTALPPLENRPETGLPPSMSECFQRPVHRPHWPPSPVPPHPAGAGEGRRLTPRQLGLPRPSTSPPARWVIDLPSGEEGH